MTNERSSARQPVGPSSLACAIATAGGLGYAPFAPGTWGSLLGWLLGVLVSHLVRGRLADLVLVISFILTALIAGRAERAMRRHDPPAIIVDEVWGMAAVLLALPWVAASMSLGLVAFLLFRLFDIAKPLPLPQLARLPSGWGILADDAGAAAYAIAILWLIKWLSG